MSLWAVSSTRRVAGQLAQRLGVGGVHDPDAAVGGGGDPVPLVLVAAESLPGLGGDLDAEAEGPAAFVQVGQRDPAGDGAVVVGGQQDGALRRRAGLVAAWATSSVMAMAWASATEGSLVPSRMKYQASASARVPGPSRRRAEPAEQGGVAELDVGAGAGRRRGPAPPRRGGGRRPRRRSASAASSRSRNAGRAARGAGRGGDGQGDDGLHDVGVVGGAAGAGLDHLVQQHGQVGGRQVPQGQAGLVGPDRRRGGRRLRRAGGGSGRPCGGRPGRPCSPARSAAAGAPSRRSARPGRR